MAKYYIFGIGYRRIISSNSCYVFNDTSINQKNEKLNINQYFWKEYKDNFSKANQLGYLLIGLQIIFILNLRSSFTIEGIVGLIYIIISFALIVITLILLTSSWAMMAHFNLNVIEILKHTIVILTMTPLHVVGILILLGLFSWSFYRLGILIPFISISILSYFAMWIVYDATSKVKLIVEQRFNNEGD